MNGDYTFVHIIALAINNSMNVTKYGKVELIVLEEF